MQMLIHRGEACFTAGGVFSFSFFFFGHAETERLEGQM
jgi:hypothetical protein